MMKGATEEQRREWKIPRDQHFTWLPNADRSLEGLLSLHLIGGGGHCLWCDRGVSHWHFVTDIDNENLMEIVVMYCNT